MKKKFKKYLLFFIAIFIILPLNTMYARNNKATISVDEKNIGKDLSWFFDGLIASTLKVDYSMVGFNKPNGYELRIINKGNLGVPFSVSGLKEVSAESSSYSFLKKEIIQSEHLEARAS